MINWDKEFEEAHLTSTPPHGLTIANFCPPSSTDRGGRNIYADDEEQILKAAKKHGYVVLKRNSHDVQFIKQ